MKAINTFNARMHCKWLGWCRTALFRTNHLLAGVGGAYFVFLIVQVKPGRTGKHLLTVGGVETARAGVKPENV